MAVLSNISALLMFFFAFVELSCQIGVDFVILTQPNPHHQRIAEETESLLKKALKKDEFFKSSKIFRSERDLHFHGGWTFYPLFVQLAKKYNGQSSDVPQWIAFLPENGRVNARALVQMIDFHSKDKEDPTAAETFLGHALVDHDHVVIHHFEHPGLTYHHAGTGFLVSWPIVKDVADRLNELSKDERSFPADFSIDPAFELAKTLHHKDDRWDDSEHVPDHDAPLNERISLEHDGRICHEETPDKNCAIYPASVNKTHNCSKSNFEKIEEVAKATLIAVKTCEKFHEKRLPTIQSTWAKAALNVKYFSEKEDPNYNTQVPEGVLKNTKEGHCQKTISIMKYFHNQAEKSNWKWLVIVDDDTILGVQKLLEQLTCYDHEKDLALGQRYGFRVAKGGYGYDYITGGGGMVFSRALVKKIFGGKNDCECPKDNAPDDMHLGACLSSLGVPITHSDRFHQARPEDYHPSLLELQDPISFHKFWNTDPMKTYAEWFAENDKRLAELKFTLENPHQEL